MTDVMPTISGDRIAALPDRPVLLYDDGCRFCPAMVARVARWDRRRRLAYLPWSHELAARWMDGLSPEVRDASMHFKLSNGRLLSGNETLAVVLCFLPGARWLGRLAGRSAIAGRVLSGLYSALTRNREFLSKLAPDRQPVPRTAPASEYPGHLPRTGRGHFVVEPALR